LDHDIKDLEDEKNDLDVKPQRGIKKSRIELPFNIWCEGCGRHIAKNVRFNSEKKQIGNYFRTPIFEFTFICPSCPQVIKMQSDPKEVRYRMTFGAKEKIENNDNDTKMKEEQIRRDNNPFARLEHKLELEESAKNAVPIINAIKDVSDVARKEDFVVNQQLRKEHRTLRKFENMSKLKARKIQEKLSLDLKVGPEIASDKLEASQVQYSKNGKLLFLFNRPFEYR
jgi:coiled-coil domain-containing protein 130